MGVDTDIDINLDIARNIVCVRPSQTSEPVCAEQQESKLHGWCRESSTCDSLAAAAFQDWANVGRPVSIIASGSQEKLGEA